MTILYDATAIRNRPSRRFGAGLLAYSPAHRSTHTVADENAYLAMLADDDHDRRQAERDYNAHLEERYQNSRQMDRVCRGPMF